MSHSPCLVEDAASQEIAKVVKPSMPIATEWMLAVAQISAAHPGRGAAKPAPLPSVAVIVHRLPANRGGQTDVRELTASGPGRWVVQATTS